MPTSSVTVIDCISPFSKCATSHYRYISCSSVCRSLKSVQQRTAPLENKLFKCKFVFSSSHRHPALDNKFSPKICWDGKACNFVLLWITLVKFTVRTTVKGNTDKQQRLYLLSQAVTVAARGQTNGNKLNSCSLCSFLALTLFLHTTLTSKLPLLTSLLCSGDNLLLLVSKDYY